MGKKKKNFAVKSIQREDIDARLYEMVLRFQHSYRNTESRKEERYGELSAAARQMAMDDDERVKWQQELTEDMKYLLLIMSQYLEENAALRELISDVRDDVSEEQKKVKRLKKEMKRARNDITNLSTIISDQGKCIKKLKGDSKDMQAVISYIGYLGKICPPNVSSKKLRKACENKFQLSFSEKKSSALLNRMEE